MCGTQKEAPSLHLEVLSAWGRGRQHLMGTLCITIRIANIGGENGYT